ncbi:MULTISPECIES: hypothetical protein [unclassified Acinetobacter]|uniref:hypothetical protein n=1 Tax=unclassified Acinetobacter TaxID=196816 RepID=UPI0015D3AF51|nr:MULTISPECIES: hypothetical protein [unclassified Acinetobacter]
MAKLTLKSAKKAVGVGSYVQKTIQFRDSGGEVFEGEILVKILTHDEKANAINHWKLKDRKTATLDQLTKAILFEAIYSEDDERFFPTIQSTGEVSTEIIDAMYQAADEVLDFSGKNWISKQKNSGANSSSMESEEEPLPKPSEE